MASDKFHPSRNLVDLEHARMHDSMLPRHDGSKDTTAPIRAASLHWAHPGHLWLTGLLPQYQRFRYDKQPRNDVAMLPNEDKDDFLLYRVEDSKDSPRRGAKQYVCVQQSLCHPVLPKLLESPNVSSWPDVNLLGELTALAQSKGVSLEDCAKRYATASLAENGEGWRFHERLGFTVKKGRG